MNQPVNLQNETITQATPVIEGTNQMNNFVPNQQQAFVPNQTQPQFTPQTQQTFTPQQQAPQAQQTFNAPIVQQQQPTAITSFEEQAASPSMLGTSMREADFTEDYSNDQLEKFPKLKQNEQARIAFLAFRENGSPRLLMCEYFYDKTYGAFPKPQSPDILAACMKKYKDTKRKFAAVIYKYDTTPQGTPVMIPVEGGGQVPSGSLMAYTFSTDKFPIYKNLHQEWNLANVDLNMLCSEPTYQKVSIMPTPQSWIKAAHENPATKAWADELIMKANNLTETALETRMGVFNKTDAEILEIVNGTAPLPQWAQQQNGQAPAQGGYQQQGYAQGGYPQAGYGQAQQGFVPQQNIQRPQQDFSGMLANQTQTMPVK